MKRVRPPSGRHRMRGFSLIEMVAAFLVFAIGMGVMMQILSTSLHTTRQSSDYTMAALWAQSKLDTVGIGEHIEEGRSNGRFDDNYSWELDIHQVDPSSVEPPPQAPSSAGGANGQNAQVSVANAGLGGGIQVNPFDLYQVDLTVYWGPRGRLRTAHFGTLRASNPDPNELNGAAAGNPVAVGAGGRR